MKKRQIGFGDWNPSPNLNKYLKDIIKSRRLTYGKYTEELEKLFCEMNGVKYSIFCSSGTAALYSAIGVLKNMNPKMDKKKYIVLPATTFISDLNVVVMNGFVPLFVDVTANYNMSYSGLESILKTHGRDVFAVMPSSLMGRPIDGLKIKELIEFYAPEAFFILDSCENMCSKNDGVYPESVAHFSCWSTYISHLLIAGACGGFIGTNSEKLAIHARSFINHGRWHGYTNIDQDNNVSESTLRDITTHRFTFVQNGLNFRMGEVEAAFALSMLKDDFQGQLKKREANAKALIAGLSQFELVLPTFSPREECRHMMLPIRVPHGEKWELIHFLEKNGIETREILPMFHPITEQYFGNKLAFQTNFPMSYEIIDKGFYIGCHQYLTSDDIEYIINIFKAFFKK
jgi:CDP-6-deoxy-D-xylo-4-hexulose-3-dehydrase